ncbi:phospholipase D family protein [Vreelandella rituensis]|uniref:DNA repair protein n=1 Tax=Vreelandella rituensis TaxID=2282306 RepID=A0A368UBD5_9GAMM|nr:phospholipase D family protein [Halomonas rituensis]RCV93622.1 DNA repair protein [Halomonas rituensis]
MAKFLNTTATNFYLEEMVKNSRERLVLISPYLKLNDRLKELLEDKNRLKLDIRLVYGKSVLRPAEAEWLSELKYVRTSFCKNLHAKCYLSEYACIITSLNLYEFSQVNNNEMGVVMEKDADPELYRDAYEEAQRILRISDEDAPISSPDFHSDKKVSAKAVPAKTNDSTPDAAPNGQDATAKPPENNSVSDNNEQSSSDVRYEKLTVGRLAKQMNISKSNLEKALVNKGWISIQNGKQEITDAGLAIGGEPKKGRYGNYIIWPADISLA